MKKLNVYFILFSCIVTALLASFYAMLIFVFSIGSNHKIIIAIWLSVLAVALQANIIIAYFVIKKRKKDLKKSFDYYVEKQISSSGLGVIIYNDDFEILWSSDFIISRMGENIIGKSVNNVINDFDKSLSSGVDSFKFEKNGFIFEAKINMSQKTIVIKDVTNEQIALKQYNDEKLVIGELEIDNYSQIRSSLSEEEAFKIQSLIIKLLDNLSDKYNFIYRQYVNGKYVFFTNKVALDDLWHHNFDILNKIRKVKISELLNLTISIGISFGTSNQQKLQELAREGLSQAQIRGGNQVALMIDGKRAQYFGSKFEIAQISSRIKIKQVTTLFEKKLMDKKIKNVVIYGHKLADLDAIGAAFGIGAIARSYDKTFHIGNTTFDTTTNKALDKYLLKGDWNVFVKPSKATRLTNQKTLVVIVDTADMDRIENEKAFKNADPDNIFIFDHHRISKLPKTIPTQNIYIDTLASSTSEIIVEAINFINIKIKLEKNDVQLLLNGIYLDTANFTKSISGRTYQAASFLENNGGSSSESVEIMKYPEKAFEYIKEVINNIKEIKPGYFLSFTDKEIPTDIISMAADEILRTRGRKAAFVIAKSDSEKNTLKMSARGFDTNVQKIAEAVGGGGHFSSAAATSQEPIEIFIDNIKHAIVSEKGEK